MSEPGNGHFDRLTEGLSSEQRIEFFRTLHEAGIADDDVELVQLLRALQLYKAFYEEIPARVREAVEDADILGARIKSLHDGIAQHLDNALAQLKQNTEAASKICAQLRDTETHLAAAVEKSAATVVESLESVLRQLLSAALLKPFENCLSDIRDQCARTANQAKQVTNELKLAQANPHWRLRLGRPRHIRDPDSRWLVRFGSALFPARNRVASTNRPESRGGLGARSQASRLGTAPRSGRFREGLSPGQESQNLDDRQACCCRSEVGN